MPSPVPNSDHVSGTPVAAEAGRRAPLFAVPLANDADVVRARRVTHRAVELLGLDRQTQTRVATAVSEIARNAVRHGGGGQLSFRLDAAAAPPRLEVTITDQGPGIADVDGLLQGRRAFEAGFGRGIANARRLVNDFVLDSSPGGGTTVRLAQRVPRDVAALLTPQKLAAIVASVPREAADPIRALREQDLEIAESLQGLAAREDEAERLSRELDETNRGVVALYSELDHTAEQLRQVSDLKSRFLSHMSHEFRTPLSSILALTRLLTDRVDGELSAGQETQIEYIRRSAQGLLEMVNDLLDLAKVEAGKLDVKPSRFDVGEMFGSLRGALKPLQRGRPVELVFERADDLPPVFGDESKVMQVLRNFISNALKFTERGQVAVGAAVESAGEHIVFSVTDTGVGIPDDAQRVIFDEFAQIEGRLQHGGTGLGLSLSRRLANLMGGEVGVRSQVGVGSTFTLMLPLQWGASPKRPAPRAGAGRRPKVLLVDDEESFRYVIRHIAHDGGFDVVEAGDGVEGLRLAEAETPEVVVLDLRMPRMDGFALLTALKERPALAQVPVVVCSSLALTLAQKVSLAGAYAIVPKHDLSRDALIALIRAALPLGAMPDGSPESIDSTSDVASP